MQRDLRGVVVSARLPRRVVVKLRHIAKRDGRTFNDLLAALILGRERFVTNGAGWCGTEPLGQPKAKPTL